MFWNFPLVTVFLNTFLLPAGRSRLVRDRSGVVPGSFGGRSGIVRRSFAGLSAIVQGSFELRKLFRNFFVFRGVGHEKLQM